MVVSEEGLAPGHLGKPQVVFMVSQPAAHHMFHKWARVFPVQTTAGASVPSPPAPPPPTQQFTPPGTSPIGEVSLPHALREHQGLEQNKPQGGTLQWSSEGAGKVWEQVLMVHLQGAIPTSLSKHPLRAHRRWGP